MKSEKPPKTMEDSWGSDDPAEQGSPSSAPGGPSYSEAWGYFHLDPAQPKHRMMSAWATCRLCGEQVGGFPSLQTWTRALWLHLGDVHLLELRKSAPSAAPVISRPPAPVISRPPPSSPAVAVEGDWARLLEQMNELAARGSRREQELEQREAALKQAELALERRHRALQEEARSMAQVRSQLQAEWEVLNEWVKKHSPLTSPSASPSAGGRAPISPLPLLPKEDPDVQDVITKVLV